MKTINEDLPMKRLFIFSFLLFALIIAVPAIAISSDGFKQTIDVNVPEAVMSVDVLTANIDEPTDNIVMLAANANIDEPAWSSFSNVKYVPIVGLSEMEKANNALATIFDRPRPHVQPVLVQIINYPSLK
jgi:predicted nucleotide-binding protein (sugar kinase/HSP70/actin superfamily)